MHCKDKICQKLLCCSGWLKMPQYVYVCTYSDVYVAGPEFRCYEVKIEEIEKGWQPPGVEHLAWAASALPLSYGNRTTTNPHNPPYVNIISMHPCIHPCIQSVVSLRLQGGTHTCFIDTSIWCVDKVYTNLVLNGNSTISTSNAGEQNTQQSPYLGLPI